MASARAIAFFASGNEGPGVRPVFGEERARTREPDQRGDVVRVRTQGRVEELDRAFDRRRRALLDEEAALAVVAKWIDAAAQQRVADRRRVGNRLLASDRRFDDLQRETISARDRENVGMVARPFAEQTAQHVDVLREVAVADGLVLPDALRQAFLGDEAAVGRKERTEQNREALGDRRDLLAAEEQAPRRVEPAIAKRVRVGCGLRPRLLDQVNDAHSSHIS